MKEHAPEFFPFFFFIVHSLIYLLISGPHCGDAASERNPGRLRTDAEQLLADVCSAEEILTQPWLSLGGARVICFFLSLFYPSAKKKEKAVGTEEQSAGSGLCTDTHLDPPPGTSRCVS